MTKFLLISDTHQEQRGCSWMANYELPEHDALLLAGDIDSPPAHTIRWLNNASWKYFGDKPIYYIAGNHEYYGHIIEKAEAEAELEASKPGSRVNWCNAHRVYFIGDVRIIAFTGWTDYRVDGDPILAMRTAMFGLNDHRIIGTIDPDFPNPQRFQPRHAAARNRREIAWAISQLEQPHDGPTIVMSHHGCTPQSIHPRFRGPMNAAFSSDYTSIIERFQPAAWVHGHTHDSHDYMVGATRVLCNPKGYGPFLGTNVGAENPEFNEAMILEIPDYVPTPRMR